jgi:glycosyltransferase involved in cell wall biosynthesis
MKILIVNTYDRGGAANACIRLHEGLLEIGLSSKLLVLHKSRNITHSYQFDTPKKKAKKTIFSRVLNRFLSILRINRNSKTTLFQKFLEQRENDLDIFSSYSSVYDITESPFYKEADIVNLHWVAGFLDYESFFAKNTKPIVWTLHDMHPFSNGPHYEEWYSKMGDQGRPEKRIWSKDEERWIAKFKIENALIFNKVQNITVVTPSKWLGIASQNSLLFSRYRHQCIPYSLNRRVFKNLNKEFCRKILDIPLDKKVVLFVAEYFVKRRKGNEYMNKALEELQSEELMLCNVGQIHTTLNKSYITNFGVIADDRLLAIIYNAADVFVIPSLMDNLPNTILESLMCGTPVIGFDIGGVPDMIKHKKNGMLVQDISAQELAKSIKNFFESSENYNSTEISEDAQASYDLKVQANRYYNLYESVLEK